MKNPIPITTLFLDVGGVLLTNGWDHRARRRAANRFKLNWAELQERHELNFEIHEADTQSTRAQLALLGLPLGQESQP